MAQNSSKTARVSFAPPRAGFCVSGVRILCPAMCRAFLLGMGMSETKYCPFCQRDIEPEQEDGVVIGLASGNRVYVHDDVKHDPDYQFGELQ
uniref:Uncharacterized protein n=2 Tax=Aeromonas salmonicida TaxID=645 RepID=A0A0F6T1N3_AERSS|nr:hypothetical protein [Aeromonas salmonicida subsp. salmonicida]